MQASELSPIIADCCSEVLDAMYFTTVLEVTHVNGTTIKPQPEAFSFSLRFRGDLRGTFGISLGSSSARTLASNFLGEDEDSLSSAEIAEVVGELSNMLCGSIVSRIGGTRNYVLSHPEACPPEDPFPDVLVSGLETDTGIIHTWVALEAPPMPVVPQVNPELAAH